MLDPRITRLAELFADHSLGLSAKDSVLIHAFDIPEEAVTEFVRVCQNRGARVAIRLESQLVRRQLMHGMNEATAILHAEIERHEMDQMTAYIALRGSHNYAEQADVPSEIQSLWQRLYVQPVVFGVRVPKTRWAVTRWPTPAMAQQANLSTPAFEKFYFDVCLVDYAKMDVAAKPLAELMETTDEVRLVGPGTDFRFSIKGIGAVACSGEANIPDGECYSCPVRDSGNGIVQYNTVSVYQGVEFKDIRLVVKDGRIVEASAGDQTTKLNEILDTDDGARHFGEWSLGFNPHVLSPMRDTLFDEKIAGSFHLTPGNAYEGRGGSGNRSAIHWDIVCIQRPEYGGGEVWFDGKLIRKDGLFVTDQLNGLNPASLA
ncbi:MAG: aminopeptidase [Fimbriimonas ginsengisoli]|uniref:Aminopeptidase n=1 Tax=Fimbriimonas ginsengisoli TaxID=1005039 RepID=A0A931LVQ6_FIMGI|nr:aminopeptidase [Fimbriimonas ginsengisoli]